MGKKFVIRGTIIDGIHNEPIKEGIVIVEDNIITNVGKESNVKISKDAEVIEGETIMPGMIDCHLHFALGGEANYAEVMLKSTLSMMAIKATLYAKRELEAGFTTVRDLGSPGYLGISLRDAIKNETIPGPRILASGLALSITGGHGQMFPPWVISQQGSLAVFADGVEEVRKEVRRQIGAGVDVIKILVTGGVMDVATIPGMTSYNYEEIKTAVDEAHKLGKKIAAHTGGLEGAKLDVSAGIDTIEHGVHLDEEVIKMMKDKGTYLIPTLSALHNITTHAVKEGIPEYVVKKAEGLVEVCRESFRRAYDGGVKIAMGTDTGLPLSPHGGNAFELELMVQNGMTSMEAIISTTRMAAGALGLEKIIGTLEKGKYADILVVDGDPLDNIKVLQDEKKIRLVMKEGKIVKDLR